MLIKLVRQHRRFLEAVSDKNAFGEAIESRILDRLFTTIHDLDDPKVLDDLYCSQDGDDLTSRTIMRQIIDAGVEDKCMVAELDTVAFGEEVFAHIGRTQELHMDIIAGHIGCGKTTYIHQFFRNEFAHEDGKSFVWYPFNIRQEYAGRMQIESELERTILLQHRDKYRTVLDIDHIETLRNIFQEEGRAWDRSNPKLEQSDAIQRLQARDDHIRGLKEKDDRFIQAFFQYMIREMNIVPIIVIDNADVKPDSFQKDVLSLAEHKEAWTGAFTIVCLRDDTFNRLQHYFLDQYHIVGKVFILKTPALRGVLKERINYTLKLLSRKERKMRFTSANKTLTVGDVVDFFNILLDTLCNPDMEHSRVIQALVKHNMRHGLNCITRSIQSPFLNPERLFAHLAERKVYIPFWIFVRSAMLGEYTYYQSERSSIPNLFENLDENGEKPYFMHIAVLLALEQLDADEESIPDGSTVNGLLALFNCSEDVLRRSLKYLCLRQLLTLSDYVEDMNGNTRVYFLTPEFAETLIHHIVPTFSYMSLVLEDTFLPDDGSFYIIEKGKGNILAKKLDQTSKFVDYLDARLNSEAAMLGKFEDCTRAYWNELKISLRGDMANIRDATERKHDASD